MANTNDPKMVPRLVAGHFATIYFEHILLSVDHGFRKPHPSIYAAALDLFGVDAAQAVFVGDSFAADFEGPTEAGIRTFLVDPTDKHRVSASERLDSVIDLAGRI